MLDRFDIHTEVPQVEYEKLADKWLGEPNSVIRAVFVGSANFSASPSAP